MSGDTVAPTDVTKDIFRRLKAQPENKICFDCPKAGKNFPLPIISDKFYYRVNWNST